MVSANLASGSSFDLLEGTNTMLLYRAWLGPFFSCLRELIDFVSDAGLYSFG